MKYFLRTEQSIPRRQPVSETQFDKGSKHEAFDGARIGGHQRSQALALRMDRKR